MCTIPNALVAFDPLAHIQLQYIRVNQAFKGIRRF
jgi:hypothetical protein